MSRDIDVIKGCNILLKQFYRASALLVFAASAIAKPGGIDSPPSSLRPPYREPSNFAPDTGLDPCLFSLAFSGCISTRKALLNKQQALVEERNIVEQFKALMNIKNEQSRLYIATLNDLNSVREKLFECDATNRTVNNAFSNAVAVGDLNSSPVEISRLAGDIRQIPEILLNGHIAYTDYVSQIKTLLVENKSLRLSVTAKDGQLATSQKEVEKLVADTAELEARVKKNDTLNRENAEQHEPLTTPAASQTNTATGSNEATKRNATAVQNPLSASPADGPPSGDYASGVAFSQEVIRAIDINNTLGIRTDKKTLIVGFNDKMSGAVKYSARELLEVLSEKQKEVANAQDKSLVQQIEHGKWAVTRFLTSPGVVKTPQGFLYRIERRGNKPLKKNVPLRLIVKESLADGTSLLDMVADGSELRQNVDDMPPIFKEVIDKLALNGSATIMIPPELAYGEEGKPPQIPPGATLIYWFEIKGY